MTKATVNIKPQAETAEDKGYNFWMDKTPCWELSHCTNMVKAECPAFKYQFLPCWEIEGTYCKLDDYGSDGRDTSICEVCPVYKKYGEGKPIQLKLMGRGINASLKDLEKVSVS